MPDWGNITLTSAISAALTALILGFWKPWLGAYGGEKGKNLARKEDLDVILAEVHAVTTAQKQIETKLSGELWDRQNHWNHKRDTYARLLEAGQKLQHAIGKVLAALLHQGSAESLAKPMAELNSAMSELVGGMAWAAIFASEECNQVLKEFTQARQKLTYQLNMDWVNAEFNRISTLLAQLPRIAKTDLGIDVS